MGNSIIDESKMPDSEEAYQMAKYKADSIIKSLRRDYSDNIIKMAFSAALNESKEALFTAIYESAVQLREDNSGAIATYLLKIQDMLHKPEDYAAAAYYRYYIMADDPEIVENDIFKFKENLSNKGIKNADLMFTGILYYYLIKLKGDIRPIYHTLPTGVTSKYDAYRGLLKSSREELKHRIDIRWNQVKNDEEKSPGFIDSFKKFLGL